MKSSIVSIRTRIQVPNSLLYKSTQDGSRYLFPVPRPLKLRISKNVLYAVCRIKACYTFHQETTFPCYMHMPIVLMNGLDIFYAVDKLLHFNDTVFAVPHILCNWDIIAAVIATFSRLIWTFETSAIILQLFGLYVGFLRVERALSRIEVGNWTCQYYQYL